MLSNKSRKLKWKLFVPQHFVVDFVVFLVCCHSTMGGGNAQKSATARARNLEKKEGAKVDFDYFFKNSIVVGVIYLFMLGF